MSAALYLELVEKCKDNGLYKLSPKSFLIIKTNKREGLEILFEQILSHKVFYEVYSKSIQRQVELSEDNIIEIMKANIPELANGEAVLKRRSKTVKAWVNWARGVILD